MSVTKPTADQIRFTSRHTGEHLLDTYLEAMEKGGRPASDLLDDLFDEDGNLVANVEMRFNTQTFFVEYRHGVFLDSETGWQPVTKFKFWQNKGEYSPGTAYEIHDIVTHNENWLICTDAHTGTDPITSLNWDTIFNADYIKSVQADVTSKLNDTEAKRAETETIRQDVAVRQADVTTRQNEVKSNTTLAETYKDEAKGYRDEAKTYADTVTSGVVDLGDYDASANTLPAKPSTSAYWRVTAAGTLDGVDYVTGDSLAYSLSSDSFYKIGSSGVVASVNGHQGVVSLTYSDVSAHPDTWVPSWSQVTGKPSSFAPSDHDHDMRTLTNYDDIIRIYRDGKNIDDVGSYILAKDNGSWHGGTKPSGAHNGFGVISLHLHFGNYTGQLGFSSQDDQMYYRSRDAISWRPWIKIYTDDYHPSADTLTYSRTITLDGDLSGSVSFDGSSDVTLNATVNNNSHNHDAVYFTQAQVNAIVATLQTRIDALEARGSSPVLSTQQAKIQASDPEAGDRFGNSVSISADGNTAIVGAYLTSTNTFVTGAAYIFTRLGSVWLQQAKIRDTNREANDSFGNSVSLSADGNTAVIGAEREDSGGLSAGAAYIFTRSGSVWSQQAKIQSSDLEDIDLFGSLVSISADGNTVIVGVPQKNGDLIGAGVAYIFTRSDSVWSQQAKIQPNDPETDDRFGSSVSLSADGNTAVIGAEREDSGGSNAGAAYIFTRSDSVWSQQSKIQSSDLEADDRFGNSVSISADGNTAIVGAYGEDTGGSNAGAAYIFTRSGSVWSQQSKIQSSDKESSDNFGSSVSLSADGNTAIVGAYGEDTGGSNAGAAYIFTRSGSVWSQQSKIQSSDKESSDNFGSSVSLSADGNTAIAGAQYEDTGGSNAGAAYIFIAA